MSTHLDDVPASKLWTSNSTGIADASPAHVWRVIESIGGDLGWYAWSVGWGVRGLFDTAIGGPGNRLERPRRAQLRAGDVVDWWVVEMIQQRKLLRLRAETKLPGVAWLDLTVGPPPAGSDGPLDVNADRTTLTLTTSFQPHGFAGLAYWLSILPAHGVVFGGMRRRISRLAEAAAAGAEERATSST